MKGRTVFALFIFGLLVLTGICIGMSFTKYDKATTTIVLGEGMTCTVNGIEVNDGDEIEVDLDMHKMKVHIETDTPMVIECVGQWANDNNSVTCRDKTDREVTSADFTLDLGKQGLYQGCLILNEIDTDDLDHDPIVLTFYFDESLFDVSFYSTVMHNNGVIVVGDVGVVNITIKDGLPHDFSYDANWVNSYGTKDKVTGEVHGNSISVTINNNNYFSTANGDMHIDMVY